VIDAKAQKAWEQHVFEDSVQEIELKALSNEAIVLVAPIPAHMRP
jgi:hypothetical protein